MAIPALDVVAHGTLPPGEHWDGLANYAALLPPAETVTALLPLNLNGEVIAG